MMKINKLGFTLVELLATLIILSAMILVAIPLVSDMLDKNDANYYKNQEGLLIISGKDYFTDYISFLPKTVDATNFVDIPTLLLQSYLNKEIVDVNDEKCTGKVVVKKTNSAEYEYAACIVCPDYSTVDALCN
ncbi:MAG: type II secretion system protein [Bacilli bacterium]|nr:type II secretion system protein [Bacilli bacterium]